MRKIGSIQIDKRFCGPPGVGNGGYVCGLLAQHLQDVGSVPQIRLHTPVPLATVLDVWELADVSLRLLHEDDLVATCQPSNLSLEPPKMLDYSQALEVAKSCLGLHFHPFPGCFVCGPQRVSGDGLRIFPGRCRQGNTDTKYDDAFPNLVAAPWVPDKSLTAPIPVRTAFVAPEFIWAALDCTGSFPIDFGSDKVLVLGQFKVQLLLPINIGDHCVVMGWLKYAEGRKHFTETVIFNSSGEVCGLGQAVWIQLLN